MYQWDVRSFVGAFMPAVHRDRACGRRSNSTPTAIDFIEKQDYLSLHTPLTPNAEQGWAQVFWLEKKLDRDVRGYFHIASSVVCITNRKECPDAWNDLDIFYGIPY